MNKLLIFLLVLAGCAKKIDSGIELMAFESDDVRSHKFSEHLRLQGVTAVSVGSKGVRIMVPESQLSVAKKLLVEWQTMEAEKGDDSREGANGDTQH